MEIAAAWSWRLLVVAAAVGGFLSLLRYFSEVTVPLAVATLLTALTIGAVDWLQRKGVPRLAATFVVVIGLVVVFLGMVALIGQQLSTQFGDLRDQVVQGISQLQDWARNGPLGLSDAQVGEWIERAKKSVSSSDSEVITQAIAVGTQLSHFVAGIFIALFALFFFLYEGDRIFGWISGLFPRDARDRVLSSGRAAWGSLTAFVRATVLVALVDAIGISAVALALNVPLAAAIGVLVFLGAFIPIVGALLSGMVAVLVALVAHGPITALFMLAGVIAVQQIESHVLQPFLMGHLVAVHPLAIILAIAAGVIVAGIVGALLAVPFAACANSVVRHLASGDPPGTDGVLGTESRDLGEASP